MRADGSVDGAGGQEDVGWAGGGGNQQCGDLPDRGENAAVRVHPGQFVLHWGVRVEFAVVAERTGLRAQGSETAGRR